MDLLKQMYTDSPDLTKKLFNLGKISEWHKVLFQDLLLQPGLFRRSGVFVTNLDSSQHTYPHHTIIPGALQIRPVLSTCPDHRVVWKEKFLYTFALAAFIQFHFVDIHPFADGNGRLCRFLSKFILDSSCPIPFPMFQKTEMPI